MKNKKQIEWTNGNIWSRATIFPFVLDIIEIDDIWYSSVFPISFVGGYNSRNNAKKACIKFFKENINKLFSDYCKPETKFCHDCKKWYPLNEFQNHYKKNKCKSDITK